MPANYFTNPYADKGNDLANEIYGAPLGGTVPGGATGGTRTGGSGTGTGAATGNGGPFTATFVDAPQGLTFDSQGVWNQLLNQEARNGVNYNNTLNSNWQTAVANWEANGKRRFNSATGQWEASEAPVAPNWMPTNAAELPEYWNGTRVHPGIGTPGIYDPGPMKAPAQQSFTHPAALAGYSNWGGKDYRNAPAITTNPTQAYINSQLGAGTGSAGNQQQSQMDAQFQYLLQLLQLVSSPWGYNGSRYSTLG